MKKPILFFLIVCAAGSGLHAQHGLLTIAEQKADYDTLCLTLERVHADIFWIQPKKEYQHKKDSIRQLLNKDISVSDFYLTIAPLVAGIRDGHTNMSIPVTEERKNYMDGGGLTFPLRLKPDNGRLFVDFPLTICSIGPGDEITGINGIDARTILQNQYTLLGAEKGDAAKDNGIASYFSALIWYKYGWGEKFDLTVKRGDSSWNELLSGIKQSEALPVLKEKLGKPVPQFTCNISDDKQVATVMVKNFAQLSQLKSFCDSVFSLINEAKIPELIIDVRRNGGGASKGVDMLMSYLSHEGYTQYNENELKVSPESKAYHKKLHPDIHEKIKELPNGSIYYMKGDKTEGNQDDPDAYKGNVTVLADMRSYSAASSFVRVAQDSRAGQTIGESGSLATQFGNYLTFKLPHSQLEYYIAFTKFIGYEL